MPIRGHAYRYLCAGLGCAFAVLLLSGCGLLGDKDRIVIAELSERKITRGELRMAIRQMPPDEKPSIRTKGDVRHALEAYIDNEIKTDLAQQLEAEGKIAVTKEQAEYVHFMMHPDITDVRQVTDPSVLDLTDVELEGLKSGLERDIERTRVKLLGEAALRYRIEQAVKTGAIEPTAEEYEREYELRKEELFHPETAHVKGFVFPAVSADVQSLAIAARRRLAEGESLDALAAEYTQSQKGAAMESDIPNDPRLPQYRTFWEEASQAAVGDFVGPVSLPGSEVTVRDASGQPVRRRMPPVFLVAQILGKKDAVQKTLEEAKPDLAPTLHYVKVTKQLHDEYGVQLFEDRLRDPSEYVESSGATGPAGPLKLQPQGGA